MRGMVLALLACSPALYAQSIAPQAAVVTVVPLSANCPVSFSASRLAGGGLLRASHPETELQGFPPRDLASRETLGLRVTFSPEPESTIHRARVTLHGLAGMQVVPASGTTLRSASESFTISPSAVANGQLGSAIYTKKLTGITWVELNELTFSNGTVWRESADSRCRVSPDGLMLVGLDSQSR